jgi:membrane carboxypeptidase/penicillin-binding protein
VALLEDFPLEQLGTYQPSLVTQVYSIDQLIGQFHERRILTPGGNS